MYFKYFVKYSFTNVFEIQNTKIHLCILYFTKYFTKYMYKISLKQRIFFKQHGSNIGTDYLQ